MVTRRENPSFFKRKHLEEVIVIFVVAVERFEFRMRNEMM
jgi:hypothetical protein